MLAPRPTVLIISAKSRDLKEVGIEDWQRAFIFDASTNCESRKGSRFGCRWNDERAANKVGIAIRANKQKVTTLDR